jgi:quinoprotein glucose dehydrogenase
MLLADGCAAAVPPADATVPPVARSAEWQSYGATPGGTHFSTADQITPANVASLTLAWTHRSGDVSKSSEGGGGVVGAMQSSLQVTPIVVDGAMYYCTPFNRVFALDAATGRERWVFDPKVDRSAEILFNCRGVSSWQSGADGFCEHRILTGTMDARLIALDAETGRRCPGFGDGGQVDTTHRIGEHEPIEYGISSPPAILGDTVITGAVVLDNARTDAPAGVVRAYDVRSGRLRWAWNPVPPGMSPFDAEGDYFAATTNVWSIIAVDSERDLVFVPTGNTNPDFFGGHRRGEDGKGLDYYSSSLVALDGSTGKVVWHYQFVHHDIWDFDTPAQPTLLDLEVNGEMVPAVVQVTKMGLTFALHRETGAPLWPVEERAVPQTGAADGEYLSPTQPFPTHLPHLIDQALTLDDAWGVMFLDEGACANRLATLENQGFYTPPSVLGSVQYPGSYGGNNWGSPAIDPARRIMVVYTNRVPLFIKLTPQAECEGTVFRQAGTPYCVENDLITSPLGLPCTAPPWGTLDAVDLDTGLHLWSVPLGTTRDLAPWPLWWFKGLPGIAAPMMTDSGLVFTGISNEHAFRAFDLHSGAELWHTRLPTAANALPISYTVDGRQFVVVAAGGHWSGGSPPGDYIMAFALPQEH